MLLDDIHAIRNLDNEERTDLIEAWRSNTAAELQQRKPSNIIRVDDLTRYFDNQSGNSAFTTSSATNKRHPSSQRNASQRCRLNSTDAVDSPSDKIPQQSEGPSSGSRHPRNPKRKSRDRRVQRGKQSESTIPWPTGEPEPTHNELGGFTPAPLLIDIRTPSEIVQEEAEARARQAEVKPPVSDQNLNYHNYAISQPEPSSTLTKDHSVGSHSSHTMAPPADAKPAYVPPHLRPVRSDYVPPHLRNATTSDSKPLVVQKSLPTNHTIKSGTASQSTSGDMAGVQLPSEGNRAQQSPAFQDTREKWSQPNQSDGNQPNNTTPLRNDASQQSSQTNGQPEVVVFKQTVAHPPAQQSANNKHGSQAWGWSSNFHAATPPPVTNSRRGGRHAEKSDRSQPRKGKRNNKWVTNKEIRERVAKAPKDKKGVWGSDSTPDWNSNPDNNPDHDVKKLVDWEGQWLPGPIDWEQRRSYRHRNFDEEMARWTNEAIDKAAAVDITKEEGFLDPVNGEVAPREWTSLRVEGISLQEWWFHHLRSELADSHSTPWWTSYTSPTSSLLAPHQVPITKVENANEEGYLQDEGAGRACERRLENEAKRKEAREKKKKAEAEASAAAAATISLKIPANRLKPKVSVYLRLAVPADTAQIEQIWNWHIQNTIHSPEMSPRTFQTINQRIADINRASLPFIVACAKNGRKNGGRGYLPGQDRILGFALADEYHERSTMYRYTAEAEVFVHPQYFNNRIGSCLLDRLLYLLDPDYEARGGYRFTSTGPNVERGGARVVGVFVIFIAYDKNDHTELNWMTKWLKDFNIKKAGDLSDMGMKLGKVVNVATFQYRTGTRLDPISMV